MATSKKKIGLVGAGLLLGLCALLMLWGAVANPALGATPEPKTPPPTWVFAGGVPQNIQDDLKAELEKARGFYGERFGIEATGFTVLMGV